MRVHTALVCLLVLALAFAGPLVAAKKQRGAPAPSAPAFGAPVVVDQERRTGEPGLKVDGQGRIFASAPCGLLSCGQSWLWRSLDGGTSWSFQAQFADKRLSPDAGGGDSDLAVTPGGRIYMADLWLGDVSVVRSDDGGVTWTTGTLAASDVAGDDRQWLATYGEDVVYMDFDQAATGPMVSKSVDGGVTWVTVPALPPDQVPHWDTIGNIVVDPRDASVHFTYTTCDETVLCTSGSHVWVASSTDGGLTWSSTLVRDSLGNSANLFASLAEDANGVLYVTWSEQDPASGGTTVYVSRSISDGVSWGAPVVASVGLGNAVMPWIVAGSAGRVDVAFYGSTFAGDASFADPSVTWGVYLAQSLDASSATPHWSVVRAAAAPNHNGGICNQGLNCDLLGGDRSLLDFFQVALDPQGYANIVYADNHDAHGVGTISGTDCWPSCEPYVTFVRQTSGPSLYG